MDNIRICLRCKERPCKKRSSSGDKYRTICNRCNKQLYGRGRKKPLKRTYRKHLKESCEICGFIPVNKCQLDIDHIDGNHKNNTIENLQTLCANCHRLKTFINRDWEDKTQFVEM